MIVVKKLGGQTLSQPEMIAQTAQSLAQELAQFPNLKMVIVTSAMGQTTAQLLELAYGLHPGANPREVDMLVTTGERLSSALLAIALEKLGIKAMSLTGSQAGIITSKDHLQAQIWQIQGRRLLDALEHHSVVVVAGFQGVSQETKDVTTLGRGGSDTTAMALGIFLKAHHVEILRTWPSALLPVDARWVTHAKPLSWVLPSQLKQLTYWGYPVVHWRAASLAQAYGIPVWIGPAHETEKSSGTWVVDPGSAKAWIWPEWACHEKFRPWQTWQTALSQNAAWAGGRVHMKLEKPRIWAVTAIDEAWILQLPISELTALSDFWQTHQIHDIQVLRAYKNNDQKVCVWLRGFKDSQNWLKKRVEPWWQNSVTIVTCHFMGPWQWDWVQKAILTHLKPDFGEPLESWGEADCIHLVWPTLNPQPILQWIYDNHITSENLADT